MRVSILIVGLSVWVYWTNGLKLTVLTEQCAFKIFGQSKCCINIYSMKEKKKEAKE